MEELKSLVEVLSKNKIKRIEPIGPMGNQKTQLQKLYLGIADGELNTDEDIAKYFYDDENENTIIYTNRLKRQLKERLINNLFFIDVSQPNFSEIQKAYYSCYKNISAIKILLGRTARKPAIVLAEKTLNKAIEFEFTDITLALAKDLRIHYGAIIGDKKKYKYYSALVKEYTHIFSTELLVEEYYSDLMINFINSKATKLEIATIAEKYATELKKVTKGLYSYRLNFLSYLVYALRYEIENDYENTIKVCNSALNFFDSKKHLASNVAIFMFSIKMLDGNIQLRKFQKAELVARECLELCPEGSSNWYLSMNYLMIIYFHSRKFQNAYQTYILAIDHPRFKQQYKSISERWHIHDAFINYLIFNGKIKPNTNLEVKKFRLTKFLNEVPTFSKDKRGKNITILILQILFLLQQKKYGAIIDRMESLKTYTHRYLRKDDTYRSNCFIKMLMQLPAADFHEKGVNRKAQKYWDKLQEVPLEVANQSAEIEIVPYEMLWEFVLESLDNRFH